MSFFAPLSTSAAAASSAPAAAATLALPPSLIGINKARDLIVSAPRPASPPAALSYYLGKGLSLFRMPFRHENLDPGLVGAVTATAYLATLQAFVTQATAAGAFCILDCHGSMRWQPYDYSTTGAIYGQADSKGNTVTVATFASFWADLAKRFMSNPRVMFEVANEPNQMDANLVVSINNAAIAAIRATGAQNWIVVDGDSYTNAGGWIYGFSDGSPNGPNGVAMLGVTDPLNKLIFDLHEYVDSSGGGFTQEGVNNTAAHCLEGATMWARKNGKKLLLGEFGGGNNPAAISELGMLLDYVTANSDVWVGATMWNAGFGVAYNGAGQNADTDDFMDMDPIIDRTAVQAAAPAGAPSAYDWDGTHGVATDARLAKLATYANPRAAFSIDALGPAKVLCHLNPTSGNTAARWSDTSGNANHFVQSTAANQPTPDAANGGMSFSSTTVNNADAFQNMSCPTLPDACTDALFLGYIAGTTLYVTQWLYGGGLGKGDALVANPYNGAGTIYPSSGTVITGPGTPGTGGVLMTYPVNNSQTLASASAPVVMANTGASFAGSISGTTLTVPNTPSSGVIKTGHAVGSTINGLGVAIGTKVVSQLTSTESDGHMGGAGTYQVNYFQNVASQYMASAAGLAKYNLYIVLDVPSVSYATGQRFIVSGTDPTGLGNLLMYLLADGRPHLVAPVCADIGPNDPLGAGCAVSSRKVLFVLRSSPSGLNMALTTNGAPEQAGHSNGGQGGMPVSIGALALGLAGANGTGAKGDVNGATDANPFTVVEFVVGDNTALSTEDHQRIVGDLMQRNGIPFPSNAMFGYAAP